jgi:hypothetical protein
MIPLTGKPIESRIGHIDRVNRPSAYNVSTGALNPATEKSAPPDPTDTGTIPTETSHSATHYQGQSIPHKTKPTGYANTR